MSDLTDHTTPPPVTPRRLVPVVLIGIVALAGVMFLKDVITFEHLAAKQDSLMALRDSHFVLSSLVFIALYVAIVTFSLPGAAVASIAGGFLFGLFPGTAYNVLAATIGASLIFSAVRYGFGDAMSCKMDNSDGMVGKFKAHLKDHEVPCLLMIRLIPIIPFVAANLVPAVVGVSLWRFVWTTFVGIIPGALVFTWVGSGVSEVIARGEKPDLGIIWDPVILSPILALAALSALPMILKALKKSDQPAHD